MNPQHRHTLHLALTFIAAFMAMHAFSQVQTKKLDKASIPKSIKYTGKIHSAVSWRDTLGNNVVILTETGETPTKGSDEGNTDAALYAYHYLMGDSARLNWRVYDYEKDCEFDMMVRFVKNSFVVTDLDKDGVSEIWLMYVTGCRSDVSRLVMKLIMYEGSKKYAVRGTNRVPAGENTFDGGEYTLDDAFKKGPEAFRKYAEQLWKKNIKGEWEIK